MIFIHFACIVGYGTIIKRRNLLVPGDFNKTHIYFKINVTQYYDMDILYSILSTFIVLCNQ